MVGPKVLSSKLRVLKPSISRADLKSFQVGGEDMSCSDVTGALAGMLLGVKDGEREAFLDDVEQAITASKEAGKKLGAHLKGMRDQLKKVKKWYEVIDEVAHLTGYTSRTILNWVEPDKVPHRLADKSEKKPFDKQNELRLMASRLNANHALDKAAVADLTYRAMEQADIADGPDGDSEAIGYLTSLIEAVAELRGMSVTVSIEVAHG
ncbi:hypothetical protein [Granulicella paludicola]|uniref:hypothetical protein n=1 Tax=Granulicella paludicola TaxID=474951 RepID=UPI0021DF6F7A|nr:hypothetical protein [Granulicella paludicola]